MKYHKLLLITILLIAFGLRVYNLNNNPYGLFPDEAARGYDAYSIAHTGADMFGAFLPLFPRSFDDYTPALYVYLTVPFVFLLDLSHFSTRLASVWIGVFTVVIAYQAIRRPFGKTAGLVGAGLLAISPWYVLLSRIGTEWTLLGLGPMLTIVLAYRGLSKPKWLIAAGLGAGLSLYGYAPVKAFLPLLIILFVIFYWRELLKNKQMLIVAFIIFVVLALPVYTFSFTPQGLNRFDKVIYFSDLSWSENFYRLMGQYVSYFNPRFLFITDPNQPDLHYIQRLKNVGLLYWFELPLIILGLWRSFKLGKRDQYFWLAWLLIAPVGINFHTHVKPALWLTATPVLHGLAGAGLVYLWSLRPRKFFLGDGINRQQAASLLALAGLSLLAIFNIKTMINDLFFEFPTYAPHSKFWGTGMQQAVDDLVSEGHAFDTVNLHTLDVASGIYVAYYTKYPPQKRQAEVLIYGSQTWQKIKNVNIRPVTSVIHQPGCHLVLTETAILFDLPMPWLTLTNYPLPNKQLLPISINVVAIPNSTSQSVQTIFGEQILLNSFALVSGQTNNQITMQPGQAICVLLNWQSTGNITNNYTVFVHLVGPLNSATNTRLWSQHDGVPDDGRRPTISWQPGEIIHDLHVLFIPPDAIPATYQLNVGLYDSTTKQNLLSEQSKFVTLQEIVVE